MLTGVSVRDVVLIDRLDLQPGPGLTVLTGETGAGKSIVLDALGLAVGARAEARLVRRGAAAAGAVATFEAATDHPAMDLLRERGLEPEPGEALVLRRQVGSDGRSRAFVNDQPAGVAVLRDLGALLLEVHGQHETVGLLDARTHRGLLDGYAGLRAEARGVALAWEAWREARRRADALRADADQAAADREELSLRLAELDRLEPREGEESELVGRRALLGGSEKSLADVADARKAMGGERLTQNLAQSLRALERARDRTAQSLVETEDGGADDPALRRLTEAAEALDRTLTEAHEALAALDGAALAFDYEPQALERAEERLFALRAAARKLSVPVEGLSAARVRFAERLREAEGAADAIAAADREAARAEAAYRDAASMLSAARLAAGARLGAAVTAELAPLKLDKARFRVAVAALPPERAGPAGVDRVEFEVATNPGAEFGPLGLIASGGELARFALAMKAALAGRGGDTGAAGPVLVFDEVDQGVGGAVADAVGVRLRALARASQVLAITHSPQVAARADAHWRVSKRANADGGFVTTVEALGPAAREEELARMLAGREVTDAARAAARALMEA